MLDRAGWRVCDFKDANMRVARGVVIRNYPPNKGHGFADYLFYIDGKASGVIEAKTVGTTLAGVETRFTNGIDSDPCSRKYLREE